MRQVGIRLSFDVAEDGALELFVHDGNQGAQVVMDYGKYRSVVEAVLREVEQAVWSLPTSRKPCDEWVRARDERLAGWTTPPCAFESTSDE